MKKRLMSCLLIVVMVMAMLPSLSVSAADASVKDWYYSQLSDVEAFLYDQLRDATPTNNKASHTYTTSMTVSEFYATANAYCAEIATNLYLSVTMDMPQLYWISLVSVGAELAGNQMIVTATLIPDDRILLESDRDTKIADVVAKVKYPSDATRYDKLLIMHDFLCETISYDINADFAFNMYGALVKGESVCEGYAESFKYLCDLAGIPCIIVVGEASNGTETGAHMWNYVQMEDGKWYAVDVTWDDLSKIYYNYFLCGSETLVNSSEKYSQNHFEGSDWTLPVLSADAYVEPCRHSQTEWVVETKPTTTESGLKVKYCRECDETLDTQVVPATGSDDVNPDSGLYTSGGYIKGIIAGETVADVIDCFIFDAVVNRDADTISDDTQVRTGDIVVCGVNSYTIILLGDATMDGAITAVDYFQLKKFVLKVEEPTGELQRQTCLILGEEDFSARDYFELKKYILKVGNIFYR